MPGLGQDFFPSVDAGQFRLHLRARSLADTAAIAAALATVVRDGDLLLLAGEMGSGKTAFAKAFGAALGVTEPITSPTFTLVHTYDSGRLTVHHADVYRLSTHHEVADLAIAAISITAERERRFDFSQPMFDAGLQILVSSDKSSTGALAGLLILNQPGDRQPLSFT